MEKFYAKSYYHCVVSKSSLKMKKITNLCYHHVVYTARLRLKWFKS